MKSRINLKTSSKEFGIFFNKKIDNRGDETMHFDIILVIFKLPLQTRGEFETTGM